MIFNSVEFLLFLPIVFILYWFVFNKKLGLQNGLVLIASYFFYGWWDWRFLFLLLLSTFIDYGFGLVIHKTSRKKLFLWLSIINNLSILAFFKYYNFFAESTQHALESFGFHVQPYFLEIALPVGISFYTFHGMSYVFDIYRGKTTPITNFIDYAVFVSFFPLLVAGPIERATHLLPQVQNKRQFNYEQAVAGMRLILWGLFKKIVIADTLASIVDKVYAHPTEYSGATLFLAAIYFSFQIYCDFSGYSDIAIGTGRLFGFELLSNFKFPYFSRNIAEFWRRWHISLSSWFRDYLYIPLGGSKSGKAKAVRNTFIIFLVSGFWHGANWTFVLWGGIHALLFIPLLLANKNRQFNDHIVAENRLLPTLTELGQMLNTFLLVTLAWIFFRAPNIDAAFEYILLIGNNFFSLPQFLPFSIYVLLFIILEWSQRRDERNVFSMPIPVFRNALYLAMSVMIVFHHKFIDQTQFIYFQF
jgi:D-alanyl-lipoteichoic acid acyltransferase DltB (MBOAT superfamily)